MSRNIGGKTRRDEMSDDEYEYEEERASTGRGATVNDLRNRGGKTRRDERSDNGFEDERVMFGEVELFISPWCGCSVPRRKRKTKYCLPIIK